MKKKQSSIDWLIEQLEEKGRAWENVSIRRLNISIDVSDYLKLKHQAKAMHKDEVESAWINGMRGQMIAPFGMNRYKPEAQEYYIETFGGDNE